MNVERAGGGLRARRPSLIAAVAGLSLLFVAGPAVAMQGPGSIGTPSGDEKKKDEPEDPFVADLTFGYTLTSGNSETTSLNFGTKLTYAYGVSSWTLNGQFVKNTDRNEETANKGSASLRYDYEPSERFFVYGRFGGSYNRPAGLDRRLAPGVGLGYDLVRAADVRLALGGGWNWIQDTFADASRRQAIYFTLTQDFDLKVNSDTDLSQTLSYLPRTGSLNDYLVHGEVTLLTGLWEWIGIKFSFIDDFDSSPFVDPETGEPRAKNDITFITGLNLEF